VLDVRDAVGGRSERQHDGRGDGDQGAGDGRLGRDDLCRRDPEGLEPAQDAAVAV
jgi:hypothetical protein